MPISSLEVSNAYSTLYVHTRTVYVRTRTEINIPNINFIRENSPDCVVLQSNLKLLFCIIKQFPDNLDSICHHFL